MTPKLNPDEDYYELFRSELLPLLPPQLGDVLDIGCGTGSLLLHLKSRGAKFTAGIEYVPAVAEQARLRQVADEVHCLDIESDELPYGPARFDCIVMSHVLEHMRDPWLTLAKVLALLKPGGNFVGAIPNVRYYPVLRDLLLRGRFQYQPSGILDRTHLRFFTRDSIEGLLVDAGLRVEYLVPEISGPKARLLSKLSLGVLNDLACYAYNFRCQKPAIQSATI
jgi:SAM-dependent methyltransferase